MRTFQGNVVGDAPAMYACFPCRGLTCHKVWLSSAGGISASFCMELSAPIFLYMVQLIVAYTTHA